MTGMQRAGAAGLLAVVAIAVIWVFFLRDTESAGGYEIESEPAATGEVRRIVTATGSVRALVTVEVGSQLSGQLAELTVDFNDRVEAGQVIARLDPQTYETRVREAEASRAVALASVQLQRAGLDRTSAQARQARLELDRIAALHERGTASQAAHDTAISSHDAAQAELAVSRAQIANAEAVLEQREATLAGARIDLERTEIRSPIAGVVVDRAVDEGQTVAASLSAPTLFTIAQDLREVQIDAQIDEADIGQIARGQAVSFTVDAYPDDRLEGRVEQIRLAPTTQSNVVTYTVVISAGNPGERLLPGMTANLDIITGERSDVLVVPNAALRFRPPPAMEDRARPLEAGDGPGRGQQGGRGGPGGDPMARMTEALGLSESQQEQARAAFRQAFARAQASGEFDREAMQAEIRTSMEAILDEAQLALYRNMMREARESRMASVWVLEADGALAERRVRIGIADSQRAEVLGGQLEAGETVITRVRAAE